MDYIIQELKKITSSIKPFVNTIYKNFEYLAKFPELSHNKTEIKRLLTDKNMMSLLVFDNGQIIAYLVGEYKHLPDRRNIYYISYMYVATKYRGKKIGSALLQALINKCQRNKIRYIVLSCDTADKKVHNFYINRGFMVDHVLRTFKRNEVLSMYV